MTIAREKQWHGECRPIVLAVQKVFPPVLPGVALLLGELERRILDALSVVVVVSVERALACW